MGAVDFPLDQVLARHDAWFYVAVVEDGVDLKLVGLGVWGRGRGWWRRGRETGAVSEDGDGEVGEVSVVFAAC